LLVPILSKALKFFKPETNPYRLNNQLSENEEYIIDATKRPIQNAQGVKVEHVLARLKRFRILKEKIRNYKFGFNDRVTLLGVYSKPILQIFIFVHNLYFLNFLRYTFGLCLYILNKATL
jgi:hypothetical protein